MKASNSARNEGRRSLGPACAPGRGRRRSTVHVDEVVLARSGLSVASVLDPAATEGRPAGCARRMPGRFIRHFNSSLLHVGLLVSPNKSRHWAPGPTARQCERGTGTQPPWTQMPMRPGMPMNGSGVTQLPVGIEGNGDDGAVAGGVMPGGSQPPLKHKPPPRETNGSGVAHPALKGAAGEDEGGGEVGG